MLGGVNGDGAAAAAAEGAPASSATPTGYVVAETDAAAATASSLVGARSASSSSAASSTTTPSSSSSFSNGAVSPPAPPDAAVVAAAAAFSSAVGSPHSPADLRKATLAVRAFSRGKDSPAASGPGSSTPASEGSSTNPPIPYVAPSATSKEPSTSISSMSRGDASMRLKAAGKAVMAVTTILPDDPAQQKWKGGATPAQALTRLTGTIFDNDSDVPKVLQGPFVAIVNVSDSVSKTVDATRAAFEGLIYWEAIVGSLNVTVTVFVAYILGRFGAGFLAIVLLMILLGGSVRRNYARIKNKIHVDAVRTLALKRSETELETVEWLNKFLQRLWAQMEPSLSESLKASIGATLASSKPAFLEDLSLSVFTLGSASPRIETIRTIARTADDMHLMDWDLNFTPVDEDMVSQREKDLGDVRQSRIEIVAKLGKGLAVIPLPIVVAEIEFKAKLRLGLKFMSKYPHVKTIEYSFLETPKIDFTLRPLKALDMMDTPGLQTFLNDIIASSLSGYVEPRKNFFDMEAFFTGTESDRVHGVLRVTVYEARNLKNQELAGVSDPFVIVKIGSKEVAKTNAIDGNLHPFWGQTYYIPVMKSIIDPADPGGLNRADELKFEIFDFNETIKHKFMGGTSGLSLSKWVKILSAGGSAASSASDPSTQSDLTDAEREALIAGWGTPFEEQSDVWRPLTAKEEGEAGKARGEVRFDLAYFPMTPTETPAETAPPADATGEAAPPVKAEDAAAAAAAKEAADAERKAYLAKLTTGVVTVTVHQAKELPSGKSGSPQCTVELFGVDRSPVGPTPLVGSTEPLKKTNNPVWDTNFNVYVSDLSVASFRFVLRDARDGGLIGECSVPLRDVVNLPPEAVPVDWYKLGTTSGKLRLTFKWLPLDMQTSQGDKAKVRRKEPIGLVRVKVAEAKGVANVEALRKSDPYCRLVLGKEEFGRTHVKDNTLDPVWNETFFTPFYAKSETLRLELWDFNNLKKDRTLGRVEFSINDILTEAKGPTSTEPIVVKSRADGLKVKAVGGNLFDVFAPIYIYKSAEDETEAGKDVTRKSTVAGNAANRNAPRQKGYLQFEVELFKVASDLYIRAETEAELDSKARLLEEAEAELRRLRKLEEVGVIKKMEGEEVPQKIAEAEEELRKRSFATPAKVLEEHPSGIIRLRVNRASGIKSPISSYIEVLIEDESVFVTRPQRKSVSPVWDALGDIFIRDALSQKITLQLRSKPVKDDSDKSASEDPILGKWTGLLGDIVGKKGTTLTLTEVNVNKVFAELIVSAGFAPIAASFAKDSTKNSGVLFLDIVEATRLEAVDSGGTSDPYCVVNVNQNTIYKTKILKKNLNPVFNESCMALIRSRLRANVTVTVRDYNAVGKDKTLGTLTIELTLLTPNELVEMNLPLEGARGGQLHVRALFDSRPETWTAIASELGGDPDFASVASGSTLPNGSGAPGGASDNAPQKAGGISALLSGGKSKTTQTQQTSKKSALDRANLMGWPTVQFTGRVLANMKSVSSFGSETRPETPSVAVLDAPPIADATRALRSVEASVAQSSGSLYSSEGLEDTAGVFAINIVEARDLKPVDNGGTSDPFVVVNQLLHGKTKALHKTKVVKKTLAPHWSNETVIVKAPPSKVTFSIKDHNMLAESKPLGDVPIDLFSLIPNPSAPTASFDVWLPVGLGGTGELHVTGEWRKELSSMSLNAVGNPAMRRSSSASVQSTAPAGPPLPMQQQQQLRPSPTPSGSALRASSPGPDAGGSSDKEKEKKRWFSKH
ncbi:hypothetical protein DFJ73DRAFT_809986 [Zopfochytrium polystomum]|nr:hypothetical protein DFJ73DRAFT_809986 [Zopfochytrium polystomum]